MKRVLFLLLLLSLANQSLAEEFRLSQLFPGHYLTETQERGLAQLMDYTLTDVYPGYQESKSLYFTNPPVADVINFTWNSYAVELSRYGDDDLSDLSINKKVAETIRPKIAQKIQEVTQEAEAKKKAQASLKRKKVAKDILGVAAAAGIGALLLAGALAGGSSGYNPTYTPNPDVLWIDPYTRSYGTPVRGHYRTYPDGNPYNNLSY